VQTGPAVFAPCKKQVFCRAYARKTVAPCKATIEEGMCRRRRHGAGQLALPVRS
jgi:hypothetical protein